MSKKHYGKQTGRPVTHEIPTPAGGVRLETFIPWRLVQRGSRKQIITPLDSLCIPRKLDTHSTPNWTVGA
ncbi:MAG: hypothetical protein V5B34_15280 [Accumulibacter sp.]|jgi:hypothetical protein